MSDIHSPRTVFLNSSPQTQMSPQKLWMSPQAPGQVFLRCFRDQIRVSRIENRVPRIRENYHRVSEKIGSYCD